MALPTQIKPLDSLRCHCLSFSPYSLPAACTLPGAQNLDWPTAERLARLHSLDFEFASPDTATKVLHAPSPLSTSQLAALHPAREGPRTGTKMVCGMDDEISKAMVHAEHISARVEQQEQRITGVLAVLVLGAILFALGECLWERYYGPLERGIQLAGAEKRLTAASQLNESTDEKHETNDTREKHVYMSTLPLEDDDDDDDEHDSPWGP